MSDDDTTEAAGTAEKAQSNLTCFVIGPIGNRHAKHGSPEREIYEEALKVMAEAIEPACERVGLSPVRADSLARAGEITEQVFRRLRDDDVVIADLTGANANVMYELGLRHTENKLTLQLGEYGRLPFDINTIRTIQFSPSDVGLINARDQLIEVLSAGLAGEYDPVTATRVWTERNVELVIAESSEDPVFGGDADDPSDSEGETSGEADSGFLDVMAEAEDQQDEMVAALNALGEHIITLGKLSESSAEEIQRSDDAGHGMRGRLQIATRYAAAVDRIVPKLEADVEGYVSALASVSAGNLELIKSLEEDPSQLEDLSTKEYGMIVRQLAAISRDSLSSLAAMVDATNENAKMARVLREPSKKLTKALNRVVEATSAIDEWDRRLQSLGIPVPPEGWKPESDEDDSGDHGPERRSGNGAADETDTTDLEDR